MPNYVFGILVCLTTTVFCMPESESISYRTQFEDLQLKIQTTAATYLKELDSETSAKINEHTNIEWDYATNITDSNKKRQIAASLDYTDWANKTRRNVLLWSSMWPLLKDNSLKRQFKLHSLPSSLELPKDQLKKYFQLQSDMGSIYSTAKVCRHANNTCNLSLEPDLTEIFRTSRDSQELKEMWLGWRHVSGRLMRKDYESFVRLGNKGAQNHGYSDKGEMWRIPYDTTTLKEDAAIMTSEMKPLYQELHAYVRRKLRDVYGSSIVPVKGPIPAHLLGNMWSQSWGNIYDLVEPFPGLTALDVTENMKSQNYTPRVMFELADDFFTSLGMKGVSEKFWKNSMISKPADREVVCHASAWDFGSGDDVRIKQCTRVTMQDLIVAHHEMGHIQYYLQYKDQPAIFRHGANPGFQEAVGDVIALSVSTPKHLHQIGLLDTPERTYESDINYLMFIALEKVAFLPFAYTMDAWRWDLFENVTTFDDMNCDWWKKRFENQGIKPPNTRSEEDFDPGAKNHIATDISYVRYLVANILQFQFHKSLCKKAGKYDPNDPNLPLHLCDIYKSKEAGQAFSDMLRLGSSKPWPEVLEKITGTRKMSSSALVEYFKPLQDWLKKDNADHKEFIGWEEDGVYCDGSRARSQITSEEGCTFVRTPEGIECL